MPTWYAYVCISGTFANIVCTTWHGWQIYDSDIVPLLVSTVRDLFDNYGVSVFIISATVRNEDTFATFLDVCGMIITTPLLNSGRDASTRLWGDRANVHLEANSLNACLLDFHSPDPESQDGFFHKIDIPIRTYRITRA